MGATRGLAAAGALAGGYALLFRLGTRWGAAPEEQHGAHHHRGAGRGRLAVAGADGWGRAGWYAYRWVDRLLFPANGLSADRLVPALQRLAVGDRVPDGPPAADCWFTVERVEPERLLVLRSSTHLPLAWRQHPAVGVEWIWSWHLSEPAADRTRLVQRNRVRVRPPWPQHALLAGVIPADFVMARSHLRGVRPGVAALPRGAGRVAVRGTDARRRRGAG
jgi:hypothetical protein